MADNSFEFFPPRTAEGKAKLRATWQELAKLKPRFFSCTYGAGGSTRDGTLETVMEIRRAGHEAAPHISCVASTRKDIGEQLERYKASGIRHLVALRGDLPSGLGASGEFRYASELVAFIRETTGDWFHIEVACYPEYHPQTRYAADEVRNFKKKVDAGANSAITQYFYNADAYFRFVEDCRAAGIAPADRSGRHADRQLLAARALLRRLRRRDPALDAPQARGLPRRRRVDPRLRPRRGDRPVREADRRRRAGPAFLHPEPGRAQRRNLAPPQAVKPLAAAVLVVAALELFAFGLLQPFENRLLDSFVRQHAATLAPDPDIVLVNIDEKSLADMQEKWNAGRFPWPREVYATLIEGIAAQKPRAIVFDIMFSEPDRFRPQSDEAFIETASRARQHLSTRWCACDSTEGPKARRGRAAPRPDAAAGRRPGRRRIAVIPPLVLPPKLWRTGTDQLPSGTTTASAGATTCAIASAAGTCLRLPARVAMDLGYPVPDADDMVLAWRGAAEGLPRVSFSDLYEDFDRSAAQAPGERVQRQGRHRSAPTPPASATAASRRFRTSSRAARSSAPRSRT